MTLRRWALCTASLLWLSSCGGHQESFEAPTVNPIGPFRVTIAGEAYWDTAGLPVSGAGDVNGDGIDDVIVGAPFNNATDANSDGTDYSQHSGAAYVVYGSYAFSSDIDLSVLSDPAPDHTIGFKILGEAAGDQFGASVSGAGDVNGDGIDDVVVGAPFHVSDESESGAAYVIYGAVARSSNVDLSVLAGPNPDNSIGFKIVGESSWDRAGGSVSEAGDVNGDGIDDVILGAAISAQGGNPAGAAYVIFGIPGGLSNIDLDTLAGPAPDNSIGFRIAGEATGHRAGDAVSDAGDVNGDGIDDVIVGAPGSAVSEDSAGAAYVIYGALGGLANIELAILAGPTPDNTKGFKITGEAAGNRAGNSVSAAGDVNGDGFDDVIIGAPENDASENGAGAAYVVHGSSSSFNIDLNTVAINHRGFKITGEALGDYAGGSVSGAGDFNGDGFEDMIVGAPLHDAGSQEDSGAAYVVHGACASCGVSLNAVASGTGGIKFAGEAISGFTGLSVSAAGDVNGDGIDDVIVGSPFQNAGGGFLSGAAYVIGGRSPTRFSPPPLLHNSP